jgi:hypothetical protein
MPIRAIRIGPTVLDTGGPELPPHAEINKVIVIPAVAMRTSFVIVVGFPSSERHRREMRAPTIVEP